MSCRIIFKNGVKTSVQDQNGKESKLFNEIIGQPHVESFDQALDIFQNIYAKEFEEGTFYKDADVKFQIIGEKGAQNLDQYKQSLNEAKELEKQGVDYNAIEDKTKWYKFKGQWRKLATEVIDSFTLQNSTKNKILTLKQVIGNENILFTFYPQINDVKVVFLDTTLPMVGITAPNIIEKSNGAYDERDRTIFINTGITKNEKYTLAHEISHVIQGVEGFAKGGNSESILSETLIILGIEEGTLIETYNLIKQADKSNLTENERKIVEASYTTIEAIYKDDNLTLSKQYSQILGEIDANVVEGTLKIKDNQRVTSTSYRELLNAYLSGRKIDVNSIFLLRNGGIKFQIIGEKGAQNLDQAQEVVFRMENLSVAKEMEKLGKTTEEIKKATGWERGAGKIDVFDRLEQTKAFKELIDKGIIQETEC